MEVASASSLRKQDNFQFISSQIIKEAGEKVRTWLKEQNEHARAAGKSTNSWNNGTPTICSKSPEYPAETALKIHYSKWMELISPVDEMIPIKEKVLAKLLEEQWLDKMNVILLNKPRYLTIACHPFTQLNKSAQMLSLESSHIY